MNSSNGRSRPILATDFLPFTSAVALGVWIDDFNSDNPAKPSLKLGSIK